MTAQSYPGVWRPGDEPGRRQSVVLTGEGGGGFALEGGGRLDEVTVAYETWGELNAARSNAVLVLHALTGDSHVIGPQGPAHPSKGWWDGLIGPGAAIDTDRYHVVCPNVLGGCQGTTGPGWLDAEGRPFGARFPVITIRDQVAVEIALADQLGIQRWAGIVGGSMGGMRVLEWCIGAPDRVARAIVVAVGAAATADEIALLSLQVRAIRSDPSFHGGDYYETPGRPVDGLLTARGIGHYTYRTGDEFEQRFGRRPQGSEEPLKDGRYAIESYLQYHGEKLAKRFDPNTYIALTEAMMHHDIGRGRGGIEEALKTVQADVSVAGITTDRLFPLPLQEEIARHLPGRPSVSVVQSFSGHDGFLLEIDQIGRIVRSALDAQS